MKKINKKFTMNVWTRVKPKYEFRMSLPDDVQCCNSGSLFPWFLHRREMRRCWLMQDRAPISWTTLGNTQIYCIEVKQHGILRLLQDKFAGEIKSIIRFAWVAEGDIKMKTVGTHKPFTWSTAVITCTSKQPIQWKGRLQLQAQQ